MVTESEVTVIKLTSSLKDRHGNSIICCFRICIWVLISSSLGVLHHLEKGTEHGILRSILNTRHIHLMKFPLFCWPNILASSS